MDAAGELTTLLREGTRDLHEAAEVALDLDARLADRDRYGQMLADLRGFYAPAEHGLMRITGWHELAPAIEIAPRCRVQLLDDDLSGLGIPVPVECSRAFGGLPAGSLAVGLGCLYVLEGSTLGGRLVARQVQQRLGAELPVAFFANGNRPKAGAQWHALKTALNTYGLQHGVGVQAQVLTAARDTFGALTAWLSVCSRDHSAARAQPLK